MLGPFHAGPGLFRSGWFVESLATQTLVIFAIRTRRVPFLRSRPSMPLLGTALAVVAVGTALPLSPLATVLGFRALLIRLVVTLGGLVGRDLPGPGRAAQAVVLRRAAQSATHRA
jgi:Mg2+-importing ATPase